MYKLYDTVTAIPQPFADLRDLLKRASLIANSNGLDALEKVEQDGELYLDAKTLRWFVNELEIRQRKYAGGFVEVLDKIVEEIELHKVTGS